MGWIWVFICTAVFILGVVLKTQMKSKNLPPGPKGFPIFGSFHLLGKLPHRELHRLSEKHGAIMHMKLGLVPTIIVSSSHAAELFLKTHDHIFASRPFIQTSSIMSYGQKDLVFAPYTSYWRKMRKMCTLELFSTTKINSFKSMRKEELRILIDYLQEASKAGLAVGLTSKVSSLSADMTCLMVFGKKYSDEEFGERGFKAVVQESMQLAMAPNLGDYIPYIAGLDLQGLSRRAKFVGLEFDGFLEKIIEEHLESKLDENRTRDFVDAMLDLMGSHQNEYQIDRSNIKALILDMLAAAMDTSATAIDWALAELIKHPQAMEKVKMELEKVVGLDRMVEESDLRQLEYLEMVVKEIFRLHPPAPLLVPHESLEDCTVDGFHIPKKSRILVNAWSIGQDPNVWIDPQKFLPERFIGSQVDVKGRDFHLIPFGSGRRGCPGTQLGLIIVSLVVAQLMHCFDWELPNGMLPNELNMTEIFGLTCPRAQELIVVPIYRLRS